jgi:hypothetical protein
MRRNRSSFTFPDFSLRRLLMQARAARGSPTLNVNRCDIEKGGGSTSKSEKSSTSASSNKVRHTHLRSFYRFFLFATLQSRIKLHHKMQNSSLSEAKNASEIIKLPFSAINHLLTSVLQKKRNNSRKIYCLRIFFLPFMTDAQLELCLFKSH